MPARPRSILIEKSLLDSETDLHRDLELADFAIDHRSTDLGDLESVHIPDGSRGPPDPITYGLMYRLVGSSHDFA
jgi:hypothetical protein